MKRAARLAFALDVPTGREALVLARRLRAAIDLVKVGKELFVREGPAIVRALRQLDIEVFLDLKFHDIPATVGAACASAARLDVELLDLHAQGGSEMMLSAGRALRSTCRREGLRRPRLLAVTVLTSLDGSALRETGVAATPAAQVARLAALAQTAGMDGVVASPQEITAVRRLLGPGAIVLTPGIRPGGAESGDQKRVATPGDAVGAGADILVVGRPIRDARDPLAAALAIKDEMRTSRTVTRRRAATGRTA